MTFPGPWQPRLEHEVEVYVTADPGTLATLGPFQEIYISGGPNPSDPGVTFEGGNTYEHRASVNQTVAEGPVTGDSAAIACSYEHHRRGVSSVFHFPPGGPCPTLPTGTFTHSEDSFGPDVFTRYTGSTVDLFGDSVTWETVQSNIRLYAHAADTRVEPDVGDWPVDAVGIEWDPGADFSWFDYDDADITWEQVPLTNADTTSLYWNLIDTDSPSDGWLRDWQVDHDDFADPSDVLTATGSGDAQPVLDSTDTTYTFDADLFNTLHVEDNRILRADALLDSFLDDVAPSFSGVSTDDQGATITLMKVRVPFRSARFRFLFDEPQNIAKPFQRIFPRDDYIASSQRLIPTPKSEQSSNRLNTGSYI